MNAETVPAAPARAPSPLRCKFIEEHKLIERFSRQAARQRCARPRGVVRAHPDYLNNSSCPSAPTPS